jgi:hypothetical protein
VTRKESKPTRSDRVLDRALSAVSDGDFIACLAGAVTPPRSQRTPLSSLPRPIRMLRVMCALDLCIATEGIWKFFVDRELGGEAENAVEWAKLLEARRVRSYLSAAIRRVSKVQVTTAQATRGDAVLKLGDQAVDPLRMLDKRYANAEAELAGCLRAYVRANRDEIAVAIDDLAKRKATPRASGRKGAAMRELTDLRTRKESVGLAGSSELFEAAMVDRVLDRLAELGRADWETAMTIFERRRTAIGNAATIAVEVGMSVATELRVASPESKSLAAAVKARYARGKVIARSAAEMLYGVAEVTKVREVETAVANTIRALQYRRRLEATTKGKAAARALLRPFADYLER